ncbi:hypothetical protein DAPPUDRAFT_113889, partial [Daphnia pulex]
MDSGEQSVEDENVILTPTEELNDQIENLTEYKSENVEHSIFQQELQDGIVSDLHSQQHAAFQTELLNHLLNESQDRKQTYIQEVEIQPVIPPVLQTKSQEPFPVTDANIETHVDAQVSEGILVPDVQQLSEEDGNGSVKNSVRETLLKYFDRWEPNQSNISMSVLPEDSDEERECRIVDMRKSCLV